MIRLRGMTWNHDRGLAPLVATAREFARSITAVADFGLREQEEPELVNPPAVQVLALPAAGALEGGEQRVQQLPAGQPARADGACRGGGEVGGEEGVGQLAGDHRLRDDAPVGADGHGRRPVRACRASHPWQHVRHLSAGS